MKTLTAYAKKRDSQFVTPQLARLVKVPPSGDDWIHEIKFDGYRTEAIREAENIRLMTRNGNDWTTKYPDIAAALRKSKHKDFIIDGEIVWQDKSGHSNFQKLQNAMKSNDKRNLVYWVFDLLRLDGKDLTSLPLIARKDRLEKLVKTFRGDKIRFSEHFRGAGKDVFKATCDLHLEGIVSKRTDAPYVSGRHEYWVKSKCQNRQEFVIGGFTEPKGSRSSFGSLLVGIYEGSKLRYSGRVGTGFDTRLLEDIYRQLKKLEQKQTPFEIASPRSKDVHWVKPRLVAEVSFANWTDEKILRAPVFQGLRKDKPAGEITQERPKEERSRHPSILKSESRIHGEISSRSGRRPQ